MKNFREAVESKDFEALDALLDDDVVFRSPVAYSPYPGKPITSAILRTVTEIFEDFRYVQEIHDEGGLTHAYIFQTTVNGLELTGCDFLTFNDEGRIIDFMVMVRPLKAAQALMERVSARFPEIQAAAAAGSTGR